MLRALLSVFAFAFTLAFPAGALTINATDGLVNVNGLGCTALNPCTTTTANGVLHSDFGFAGSLAVGESFAVYVPLDIGVESINPLFQAGSSTSQGALELTYGLVGGALYTVTTSVNYSVGQTILNDIYSSFFNNGTVDANGNPVVDLLSIVLTNIGGPLNSVVDFVAELNLNQSFCVTGGGFCDAALHLQDNGGGGTPAPVPVPAAGLMLLGGLAGLAAMRRRRTRNCALA